MSRKAVWLLVIILLGATCVAGCKRTRVYSEDRQRVDQNLSEGNRGYLTGQAPAIDESARKQTRKTYTLEVDLPPYYEPKTGKIVHTEERAGYAETPQREEAYEEEEVTVTQPVYVDYVVKENDTLQKISQAFYGTTKKWNLIYEANKDVLKSPDRVYPGQKLRIPK